MELDAIDWFRNLDACNIFYLMKFWPVFFTSNFLCLHYRSTSEKRCHVRMWKVAGTTAEKCPANNSVWSLWCKKLMRVPSSHSKKKKITRNADDNMRENWHQAHFKSSLRSSLELRRRCPRTTGWKWCRFREILQGKDAPKIQRSHRLIDCLIHHLRFTNQTIEQETQSRAWTTIDWLIDCLLDSLHGAEGRSINQCLTCCKKRH